MWFPEDLEDTPLKSGKSHEKQRKRTSHIMQTLSFQFFTNRSSISMFLFCFSIFQIFKFLNVNHKAFRFLYWLYFKLIQYIFESFFKLTQYILFRDHDHSYITSAKGQGACGQKMVRFADVLYCIYADIVGGW